MVSFMDSDFLNCLTVLVGILNILRNLPIFELIILALCFGIQNRFVLKMLIRQFSVNKY